MTKDNDIYLFKIKIKKKNENCNNETPNVDIVIHKFKLNIFFKKKI